jgi:hypothetical protein
MSETEVSMEDRLNFLSDITGKVVLYPKLSEKLISCLTKSLNDKKSSLKDTSNDLVYYHSPQKMIEFLRLFSVDDDFKWYTHKWDISTPFNLDQQKDRQKITKDKLKDMAYPKVSGPKVNEKTYTQIWNFINFLNSRKDVYTWTNTKFEYIREGWHSIIDLSHEHPSTPIDCLKLKNGRQFKDYIRMFKATIEFRTDLNTDDRFSELIWNRITAAIPKDFEVIFQPQFDDIGYDLNVYCDVIGLLSGLNIICSWITKHKTLSSKVAIDLISSDDYYILEIYHIGSYFNNIEKLEHPSGDLANLRKRLFSVCDFSMEGDFVTEGHRHGSITVNALDEKVKLSDGILSDCDVFSSHNETGGVKYRFKIYRQ